MYTNWIIHAILIITFIHYYYIYAEDYIRKPF